MKHDVLTFIDSDTLRDMLRGKELAPAVECILIAKSRKQSLTKKLEALTERADAYTETEFQNGVYHLCDCDDFSDALRKYIAAMEETLALTQITDSDYIYQPYLEDVLLGNVFSSFEDAVKDLRGEFWDDEQYWVVRRKINDPEAEEIEYILNADFEITSIRYSEPKDWDIREAFAELPDDYRVGDIVYCKGEYYVVTGVNHADRDTSCFENAGHGDMALYCLGYHPDKTHSCGGTFGHHHVPLLQAERVKADEMPYNMRPLKGFHFLLTGELQITEFLEAYSNGSLDDLVCFLRRYHPKKKE